VSEPAGIAYPHYLEECVRRAFVPEQGPPPVGMVGLHREALAGVGDPLLPYLQTMSEGDLGSYDPASFLHFGYLLADCTPRKRVGVLRKLADAYDNTNLRSLLLSSGDPSSLRQFVKSLKERLGRFPSTAAYITNMVGPVRKAMVEFPELRREVEALLAEKRRTPEYLSFYKLYILFELKTPRSYIELIRKENEKIIRQRSGTNRVWHSSIDTIRGNIHILRTVADDHCMEELLRLLRSDNPHVQLAALRCIPPVPEKHAPRFLEAVNVLIDSPFTTLYGSIGQNLAGTACMSLLQVDAERGTRILLDRLESCGLSQSASIANALLHGDSPLTDIAELRRRIPSGARREALEMIAPGISTGPAGFRAGLLRSIRPLVAPSQFYGSLGLRDLRKGLQRNDRDVREAVVSFLRNGRRLYFETGSASHIAYVGQYFLNLWSVCRAVRQQHPDSPHYPPWFWLCATTEESRNALDELADYMDRAGREASPVSASASEW
jgi:hypothetical protein